MSFPSAGAGESARVAQAAYGCPVKTKIEIAENAGGKDVYTALPRRRSQSFVVRFIATNTRADQQLGGCRFSLVLRGLEKVEGTSDVAFAPDGQRATWTVGDFGSRERKALTLKARARTSVVTLRIDGVATDDGVMAYETTLRRAPILRSRGSLTLAVPTPRRALRNNTERTFSAAIKVARCLAAETGALRVHFQLPTGLRGKFSTVPKLLEKRSKAAQGRPERFSPECRVSFDIRFSAVRSFAGKRLVFWIRSSKGAQSNKRSIGVAR